MLSSARRAYTVHHHICLCEVTLPFLFFFSLFYFINTTQSTCPTCCCSNSSTTYSIPLSFVLQHIHMCQEFAIIKHFIYSLNRQQHIHILLFLFLPVTAALTSKALRRNQHLFLVRTITWYQRCTICVRGQTPKKQSAFNTHHACIRSTATLAVPHISSIVASFKATNNRTTAFN